jgi:hypothetical protein
MKNIVRAEAVAVLRARVLESKRATLSVTALHAVNYLLTPLPALPVAGDARAEARMVALHRVARRGALRDVRRYRLALWVLGKTIPTWVQV